MSLLGRPFRNRADELPALAPDHVAVLHSAALLQPHEHVIAAVRRQVGVPQADWNALYLSLFERLATYVQQLPASEAHHHSGRGGLLEHALEVALQALTLRRGLLIPPGASAEELAEKHDVWTYAAASAAVLHDIGKPICDQRIALSDVSGRSLGDWDPLGGPISPPAASYRVHFRRGRRFRLHPLLPPLVAHFIVPAVGLRWLASDPTVFESWLATISGGDHEFAGELGKLIRQADSHSVASNLSGGDAVRENTSGPRPFAERLGVGLRFLVDQHKLPLNKPGAAAWVTENDLWLVSKRVLDALREHLISEGQPGIPGRNDRLMDEMQSGGLLLPNVDRAIWNATIRDQDWSASFTLLRVPLSRLWPAPASRPPRFQGEVVPSIAQAGTDPMGASDRTVSSTQDVPAPMAHVPTAKLIETKHAERSDLSVQDADVDAEPTAPIKGESVVGNNKFLAWLSEGIVSGRLKTNAPDARVHYVSDGLFLVSPAVFRDFAGVESWASVQKEMLELRLHLKTPKETNVWSYRVVGPSKKGALLRGIVIPSPETTMGIVITRVNPILQKVVDDSQPTAESI
ncbi:MAG: MobH family relaxase [Panacagrimonas sp.]